MHELNTICSNLWVLCGLSQTGSGKTHTMIGNGGGEGDTERGVYALAAMDLFEQAKSMRQDNRAEETEDATVDEASVEIDITVSYFELYKGQLYDLLEVNCQSVTLNSSQIQCLSLSMHK